MNERIRELAEEHGFIHKYMTIGERNDALTKYKEFAQLIVQEAAAFVSGAAEVHNQAEQDACVRASKGLKKYFGVEE